MNRKYVFEKAFTLPLLLVEKEARVLCITQKGVF
jgi:hypothetical protein